MAETIETLEFPMLEEILVMDDMPQEAMIVVEEPKEKGFELDNPKTYNKFLTHLQREMSNLPPHSGQTTAGCERVIAKLKTLDKLISKVISQDLDCQIDDQLVEKLRKDIRKMVKQLEKKHKEINDAYDADDVAYASTEKTLVKEATDSKTDCACKIQNVIAEDDNCPKCKIKLWKAAEGLFECVACDEVFERKITKEATTAKIQLVMSPFERAITGAIVNAHVSQGKNPEHVYDELKTKYKFSDRDELSIRQILADMGYPIMFDRGLVGEPKEELNKGKGVEFSTQYQS